MALDALLLARLQFALTVGFHFIFPPVTIGLAWLLVLMEWRAWRSGDPAFRTMARRYARILAVTFVTGVASGIVMEFQFGTNWGEYSKFVGDVFGAPLAAEAVFSFFLESVFLGLYLFGGERLSPRLRWFSGLMVAVGSTLSAFWIIVANSWQQTPAGFVVQNGRAELLSFYDAVFNPSTFPRFFHTMDAALATGAFAVAGVAAFGLLRNPDSPMNRKALRLGLIAGLILSVLQLMPFGDWHARQVAENQPEKLAAMEGLFESGDHAPLTIMGFPTETELKYAIRIPSMLSLLVGRDANTYVAGLNEFAPEDRPPVAITFLSFHAMVGLGSFFIALTAWACLQLFRGRIWRDRKLLWVLIASMPLPILACELGWITTEVGRQPWVVYGVLRTADGASISVTAGEILASIIMFGTVYALLGVLYLFLIIREIRRDPESTEAEA